MRPKAWQCTKCNAPMHRELKPHGAGLVAKQTFEAVPAFVVNGKGSAPC